MGGQIGQIGLIVLMALWAHAADQVPLNQRQARVSPAWITDGVMYQLWLRAFTPEGTLKAAAARLPKVAEAGVTVIYLSPVCLQDDDMDKTHWAPRQRKTDNPRNPYRIKDYEVVDPEYGTDADLRAFVKEAHRLGLRVLLDIVYLHCGPTARIIAEYPAFMQRNADGGLKYAQWGFPAIEFSNPGTREYFWKNMEYWVREFDVDGFRCDVADGIPLDFWETARDRLERVKPDVGMLAEGTKKENQLKAFDISYGWGGAFKKWDDAAAVRALWEKMRSERPQGGARFIRFIENHDFVQDEGSNRLDKVWGVPRVNAVLVALYTLDGVPMLYNGQEFADVSRNSLYAKWPIDWAVAETPAGQARFALCQKLSALRKAEPALTRGEVVWLDNDQPAAVLSFLRASGGERILTVVNLTGTPVKVTLKGVEMACKPLLACGTTGETQEGFSLEPYGYLVGRAEIAFDGLKAVTDYNDMCMANGLWVGGVLLVGTADTVVFRQAWGWTAQTKNFPVRTDSIFDLASVTKAVGTTTALAICMDRGWVDPDAVFTNYLPGYKGTLRGPVTVRDLSRHLSGFDNSKPYTVEGQVTNRILEFSPVRPAGEPYEYSCGNTILLGLLVEHVSGMSLADFCREHVWTPLAMSDTQWTPLQNPDPRRVVKPLSTPTLGVVSDEPARAAGRPIGNAGLFSTADDLATFCRMVLKGGIFNNMRIMSESAIQTLYTRPDTRSPVAFGWRVDSAYTPSALSTSTLSHTGYTGHSVWIDPAHGLFVILLTNRTGDHDTAKNARIELADRILKALQ
jgi:CubicO group peptidase (beta-lactamase class C family)/glycosidase